MKVRGSALSLLLMFMLISTAYAQDMRLNSANADISFSGTTANCYVDIVGDSGSDKISATIKLNCGDQTIKTWNEYTDRGHLLFYDTVDVSKGKTYVLVVEYTVNNKARASFSDSGTCK